MKINIEIDSDLWAKFKEKVRGEGKTLTEAAPQLMELALRNYIEPPVAVPQPATLQDNPLKEEVRESYRALAKEVLSDLPIIDRPATVAQKPVPQSVEVPRCELCDKPSPRRHPGPEGKAVCYECWKGALTNSMCPS